MGRLRDHIDGWQAFLLLLTFGFTVWGAADAAMLNRLRPGPWRAADVGDGPPPAAALVDDGCGSLVPSRDLVDLADYVAATPWVLWVFVLCLGVGHAVGVRQGRAERRGTPWEGAGDLEDGVL